LWVLRGKRSLCGLVLVLGEIVLMLLVLLAREGRRECALVEEDRGMPLSLCFLACRKVMIWRCEGILAVVGKFFPGDYSEQRTGDDFYLSEEGDVRL
jgi:hypothetical protein